MSKFYIGNIVTSDNAAERRIALISKPTFALVSNSIPGNECAALKDAPYVWKVEKEKRDRKGDTFFICTPIRKLSALCIKNQEDYTVKGAVLNALCNDLIISAEQMQILRRMARSNNLPSLSDQDVLSAQDKLIEKLTKGEVSDTQLLQQAYTPIQSAPDQALLIPLYANTLEIGRVTGIFLQDKFNRDCRIHLTAKNLDEWKSAIPEYLLIKRDGEKIRVDFDMNKVSVKMIGDNIPNYDPEWTLPSAMKIIVNKSGEQFCAYLPKNDPQYSVYMNAMGLCIYENQYIPLNHPAWSLANFSIGEKICDIHSMQHIQFENGMYGFYPAIYMVKKYPGPMKGMDVRVIGHSIETMQFLFSPKW